MLKAKLLHLHRGRQSLDLVETECQGKQSTFGQQTDKYLHFALPE